MRFSETTTAVGRVRRAGPTRKTSCRMVAVLGSFCKHLRIICSAWKKVVLPNHPERRLHVGCIYEGGNPVSTKRMLVVDNLVKTMPGVDVASRVAASTKTPGVVSGTYRECPSETLWCYWGGPLWNRISGSNNFERAEVRNLQWPLGVHRNICR